MEDMATVMKSTAKALATSKEAPGLNPELQELSRSILSFSSLRGTYFLHLGLSHTANIEINIQWCWYS